MSCEKLTCKDRKKSDRIKSNNGNTGWNQFTEYLLNNSKEMKNKKTIAGVFQTQREKKDK